MLPLKVAGLGVYLPERRETKTDFIQRGVPPEAIERLGVYERRVIPKDLTAADMEIEAARSAIANAGIQPDDIDLIISATFLPEMIGIPNSNLLQNRLGAKKAAAFDIGQACGSVVPGMIIAANFLALGQYRKILLTASTNWSVIADPSHPSADFVLGDGAAAVVLIPSESGYGILSFDMQTNGSFYHHCGVRIGHNYSAKYYEQHQDKLLFFIDKDGVDGRGASAFKEYLMTSIPSTFKAALNKTRLSPYDINCAIIHGNIKPLTDVWIEKMGVPAVRFPLTYQHYGNINAATILVNLHKGLQEGMIEKGNTVAFVSLAAGFSAGTIIMRWE